jgi:hypothetical protein
MEKLIYLFSLITGEVKKRKPADTGWYWWIQNSLIDGFIAFVVWIIWLLTMVTRTWSVKKTTIAELSELKEKTYSVDQIVKTLQTQYTGDMQVIVLRYPYWRVGYNAWTFRVSSGVSNNKTTALTVIC